MFKGPNKVVEPMDGESTFGDWQDFKREGETHSFEYSDSTEKHIGAGEEQKFHYEGNRLPEKE